MAAAPRPGLRALDALNFTLADVRDGLGPYLAVYLLAAGWTQAGTGLVLAVGGIAALIAQAPAGALVDAVRERRLVLGGGALIVTATCLLIPAFPQFWPVLALQAAAGAASAIFVPAIAAVTLGLVGRAAFSRRTGRNEGFNHAGNAFAAAAAGGLSLWFGPIAVFWLLAGMALASLAATAALPADGGAAAAARDTDGAAEGVAAAGVAAAWGVLSTHRPLLIFAACVLLFHLANAAMLPLVGQQLAQQDLNRGTALMSACIVAAQLVMVPMAALAGARADRWGRKPIFLAGFAVLAVRGLLYPLSDNPYWLVAVQTLDGVGAGLFGVLMPVIVADLTRGRGHFGAALGLVATAQGIGAAVSNGLAGWVAAEAGYAVAFWSLAAVAVAGAVLFWRAMPETAEGGVTAGPATA